MPIYTCQQEAEIPHHCCRQDKKTPCANGPDWNTAEEIPVRCIAPREAQSRWITAETN